MSRLPFCRSGAPRPGLLPVLSALLLTGVLLAPGVAEAKLVVINTGEEIYEVADFDEATFAELYGEVPQGDWKLGYMCSHFGIFWADVWTWSCELVAFEGETYADLPPEMRNELEAQHPWSQAQRSMWNKYGVWAFAGLIVVGVVVGRNGDDDSH